jgi:hypothetical protein
VDVSVATTNIVNCLTENTLHKITSTYAVLDNAGNNNGSESNRARSGGDIGSSGTTIIIYTPFHILIYFYTH